jgi:hypothetical protein
VWHVHGGDETDEPGTGSVVRNGAVGVSNAANNCRDGIVREKRMSKYIGETARSTYERGFEHLSDVLNLSLRSHMLRHYVDSHMGEEFDSVKFPMKVIRYKRTSFERQILESVLIHENRCHNLLNSKSEYNRCSIPRITLNMGDSEVPYLNKKAVIEMKKEEAILAKIRDLRKQNKRKRGNARGNPVRKKIKLDEDENDTMVEVIPDNDGESEQQAIRKRISRKDRECEG